MALLAFDYTQLAEPNLLIPGEKPIGPIEIDLSNEFGKHVIAGICQGKQISHDITARDPKNTGGFELYSGATIVNDNVYSRGDNECALSRNQISFTNSEPLSFVWRGIFRDIGSPTFRYFLYCQGYQNFSAYVDASDVWYIHGDSTGSGPTIPKDAVYSAVVVDPGNGSSAYVYLSFSATIPSVTSARLASTDYLAIGGREDSPARFSDHEAEIGILLNKALSEAEARRWMDDPYQLFRPAGWQAPVHFLGAAAAPPVGGGLKAGSLSLMGLGI